MLHDEEHRNENDEQFQDLIDEIIKKEKVLKLSEKDESLDEEQKTSDYTRTQTNITAFSTQRKIGNKSKNKYQ